MKHHVLNQNGTIEGMNESKATISKTPLPGLFLNILKPPIEAVPKTRTMPKSPRQLVHTIHSTEVGKGNEDKPTRNFKIPEQGPKLDEHIQPFSITAKELQISQPFTLSNISNGTNTMEYH